jgi:hypothetical protein
MDDQILQHIALCVQPQLQPPPRVGICPDTGAAPGACCGALRPTYSRAGRSPPTAQELAGAKLKLEEKLEFDVVGRTVSKLREDIINLKQKNAERRAAREQMVRGAQRCESCERDRRNAIRVEDELTRPRNPSHAMMVERTEGYTYAAEVCALCPQRPLLHLFSATLTGGGVALSARRLGSPSRRFSKENTAFYSTRLWYVRPRSEAAGVTLQETPSLIPPVTGIAVRAFYFTRPTARL